MATPPATTMVVALRRSGRSAAAAYDSNGRQYLASTIGWTREELEEWLRSATVYAHLLLWYHLCYISGRRSNDAIDWINMGPSGYFYNLSDLEEDLLLLCLGEGNEEDSKNEDVEVGYAAKKAVTYGWSTQELWTRTAWRIVQSNRGPGQAFESLVVQHPAKAYALAIDILCLAFHSLAFRQSDSVWEGILNCSSQTLFPYASGSGYGESDLQNQIMLDREPNNVEKEPEAAPEGMVEPNPELSTLIDDDDHDDEEYTDPESLKTHETSPVRMNVASPKAPRQAIRVKNVPMSADKAQRVLDWMETLKDDSLALDLRDEDGIPITGYRMTS